MTESGTPLDPGGHTGLATLIPLAQLAWADGEVDPAERHFIWNFSKLLPSNPPLSASQIERWLKTGLVKQAQTPPSGNHREFAE